MNHRDQFPLKRRHFIRAASLAGSGALMTVACGEKQQEALVSQVQPRKKYQWKMVTTWPKNFPGLGTGANYLANRIATMSDGQLTIKVYGAGELVPALNVFDAVSQGTAEMGHSASYYWKGKHEATQFFSAVPFGLTALEMNAWLRHAGGLELWDELYAAFGMKAFPVGNTGVQMGGWFNREVNDMAAFSGLKMRMPGLGGEVLRRLKATVVNLPGGEIYQALKTGTIDATEWVGPYNDLAFGFYQAAKYYYWPGWHEPGTTLECMLNLKAYESLPAHLRSVVQTACQAANEEMHSEFVARNSTALRTLLNQHGVKLRRFPNAVLQALGATSKEVVAEIAEQDPLSRKIFTSFDRFRDESSSYTRISEAAYTQARSLTFA